MNGVATTTNERGEASIQSSIVQDTRWVNVSKLGFKSRQVEVPTRGR
jgi:hypothetical protein